VGCNCNSERSILLPTASRGICGCEKTPVAQI